MHVPWRARTGWDVSKSHRREDSALLVCKWGVTPLPPPSALAPAARAFSRSLLSLSSSAPSQLDVLQFRGFSEIVEQTNGLNLWQWWASTKMVLSWQCTGHHWRSWVGGGVSTSNQRQYLNLRLDAPEPEKPGWQLRHQVGFGWLWGIQVWRRHLHNVTTLTQDEKPVFTLCESIANKCNQLNIFYIP